MEQSNRYDGVHPRAVQFIRYHARQLARLCAVPGMDIADYEQELAADLLERSDRFDPSRSSYPTFADRLIRKRVASLLESGSRMRCASAGWPRRPRGRGRRARDRRPLADEPPPGPREDLPSSRPRALHRAAANPTAPLLHVAHGLEPAHGRVRDGPAPFLPLRGGGRVEAARRRGWSRPLSVIAGQPDTSAFGPVSKQQKQPIEPGLRGHTRPSSGKAATVSLHGRRRGPVFRFSTASGARRAHGDTMPLHIVTADERLAEANSKTTVAIFGPPGVGKTSLLWTLPGEHHALRRPRGRHEVASRTGRATASRSAAGSMPSTSPA